MPNGTAAAASSMIQAIKASGAIVRVDPNSFSEILRKSDSPLVVTSEGWLFGRTYQYLTSYKGLCFFTKAPQPIQLPGRSEVVSASRIWIPA
jgi:hypothetical protein